MMSDPRLPRPRLDWAFFVDVDGTLLEIAATPDAVRVDRGLTAMLATLYEKTGNAVALLSGRQIADLDRLFWPLRLPAAGVHGLERRRADGSIERAETGSLDALRAPLAAFEAAHPGVRTEDKGLALALHYRNAPECAAEARALAEALIAAHPPGVALIAGKMVLEFRTQPIAEPAIDKGTALARFMAEKPFRLRRPFFAGDDVTDEDGFRAVRRLGGIALRIGDGLRLDDGRRSAAAFSLPSVAALRSWLGTALDSSHP
jgi:trehalose 6-phosphate phosphatase